MLKKVHVPDTTNNWFASSFDVPQYHKVKDLEKQLHLKNLENDTASLSIRIWIMGSNYNPQELIIISNDHDTCSISRTNYYLNIYSTETKIDSIAKSQGIKRNISLDEFKYLMTDKLWELPSQGEMKNGKMYGCNDGYVLAIEVSNKVNYKFTAYVCPDFHRKAEKTFDDVVTFVETAKRQLTIND